MPGFEGRERVSDSREGREVLGDVWLEERPHILGHAGGQGPLVLEGRDLVGVQPGEVRRQREALRVGGPFGSRLRRLIR